jgi:hypothetical protein
MPKSSRFPFVGQDHSLFRQFAQAPGLPFADVLPAALVQRVLDEHGVAFRDRLFPPAVTVALVLSQVQDDDPSLRQAVARFLAQRRARGLAVGSADTGAYCKARQRLPEGVLATLTRRAGAALLLDAPPRWCWRGRDVKIVDGTTVSGPDTTANQAAYPQQASQKPGLGFPLVRCVALFSLAVGAVLDAAFAPYKGKQTGEPALLRALHHHLDPDDILLGDRCFCSYFEVAELHRRGVDVVLRLHQRRRVDFRRGRHLGPWDHLVTWQKPQRPEWMDEPTYRRLPEALTVRELRFRVGAKNARSRVITLATTLSARAFPKGAIADLYRARWRAELDLRSLKSILHMDILRGRTPAMLRKELWAHFLAYNLIRTVMAQAALTHHRPPHTISFKGTLQLLRAFAPTLLRTPRRQLPEVVEQVLRAVVRHRVGHRPGRLEPRARKRHSKPYPWLTIPRPRARTLELRDRWV